MDQTISASEISRHFSRILRDVRRGHCCVVTVRGKPVARIVPFREKSVSRGVAKAALLRRLATQQVTDIGGWSRGELYGR